MNTDSYILFINYLYNINNIPICLIEDQTPILQIPSADWFYPAIQPYVKSMLEHEKDVTYMSTSYEALYGLIHIRENDELIFVGPYFTTPVTQDYLSLLMTQLKVNDADYDHCKIFLTGIPSGPLHRFLSYLSCLNFCFNHDILPIEDMDYNPNIHHNQEALIQKTYTTATYESRENDMPHNTYLHEMHRLELIANGDTEGMRKLIATPVPGNQGHIGNDSLRQAKNIFIAACTLYTRAAISGGLDAEEAYNLSDVYIQTSENYKSVSDVERLMRQMPMDFTERVEREVKFKNVSPSIVSAIHYIKEHVNQPLQAQDIAWHVNLSTSYFLKRFKAETGVGISEFINQVKVEEACVLLTYTEKSLTEISNYLYFSSQSYFQNVFKKIMGVTPGVYRNAKKVPPFMQNDH